MRKMVAVALLMGLVGCGGMEGITARRMNDAELKTRLAAIEREQASYQPGESDAAQLRRFERLSQEESEVGRELLRRCQAGDKDACLPRFNMMRE